MIVPKAFLDHADKITAAGNNPQEVEFRCAVSRAYYSMYHEAYATVLDKHKPVLSQAICELLDQKNRRYDKSRIDSFDKKYVVRQGVNFHRVISTVLGKIGGPAMSNDFNVFRDERNTADYNICDPYPNDDARNKVTEIKRLIQKIKEI